MLFSVFPIRVYQLIAGLLGLGLMVSFVHRAEYFDDAWFAEQAYWLLRVGHVRSTLFSGLNGWETQIYVFHKLFIYTEALLFSGLGISVGSSKAVGVLFGLAGLIMVWQYPGRVLPEQRWLAVVLYLGCGTLIRYVCLNRPEPMCMALGFASFYVLQRAKGRQAGLVWSALLAGMAALTHLNGIAYMLAGAVFIGLKRGWPAALIFGIISGTVLSLYLADAILADQLPVLISQFRHDPATKEGLNAGDKLTVMAKYHELFFHSENEAALSILALLSLLVFRRYLHWSQPVLLYTVLLIGAFWLITKGNTDIYFLLFLPWLALLVAELAVLYLPNQPHWQQPVSRLLIGAYLLLAGMRLGAVLSENIRTPDTAQHNARLARFMPERHSKIIAPLEFFFGQMENYRIRGLTYYYLLNQTGPALPLSRFFELAQRDSVLYIISDHGRNASYPIPATTPGRIGGYRRVYQDEWSSVYARQRK